MFQSGFYNAGEFVRTKENLPKLDLPQCMRSIWAVGASCLSIDDKLKLFSVFGFFFKRAGVSKQIAIELVADWARDQMSFEFISRGMLVEYVHRGYDSQFKGCPVAKTIDFGGENFCTYAASKESCRRETDWIVKGGVSANSCGKNQFYS